MGKLEYVGTLFEEWRPVKGYEGLYEVSNCGRVRSLNYLGNTNKVVVLRPGKNRGGYLYVNLYKDTKMKTHLIHRLVYEAFRGAIPEGLDINHLDERKDNNWLYNLETCTRKENLNHGTHNERVAKANINNSAFSKPVHQIDKVTGKILNTYPSANEAQRQTGVNHRRISACCLNRPKYKSAGSYKWKYA